MGVETFGEVSRTSQRRAKRSRVLLSARLRTDAGEFDARLRDLSRKGALVECQGDLSVGDEIIFTRGQTVVPARVAWIGGNRLGIEFLQMIYESEVRVQISKPPPKPRERFPPTRTMDRDVPEQDRQHTNET